MALLTGLGLLALPALAHKKSGQALIDSLLVQLPRQAADTNRVKTLHLVAFTYADINTALGLQYARQELALAQRLAWPKGGALAYRSLGWNYYQAGNETAALENFFRALELFEQIGSPLNVCRVLNNLGNVYGRQGDFAKTLTFYTRSLRMAQALGSDFMVKTTLQNIAITKTDQGQYREALHYHEQALQLTEKLDDQRGTSAELVNIGYCYLLLKEYGPALAYLRRGLRRATVLHNNAILGLGFIYTGTVYCRLAEAGSRYPADSLVPAGEPARLRLACRYLRQGIATQRATGHVDMLLDGLSSLSQALALQGDYRTALAAHQQYLALHDTLDNAATRLKLEQLETRRTLALKSKNVEIARLAVALAEAKKRNERVGFGVGLGLLLLLGSGLLWRFRQRQTQRQAAHEAQLRQRLAADLHDDVGNLLTQITIQSSLLRENQYPPAQALARLTTLADTARQAAQQMGDVVRGLEVAAPTLPQLVDRLRDHAQEVLPPAGLDVDFRAPAALPDTTLPAETSHNLYLIYKEALHNVVKHAQATQVTVRLAATPAALTLRIADDGRGHDGTPRPGGHGLRNLPARAQAVGGTVRYPATAQGFVVEVVVPLGM